MLPHVGSSLEDDPWEASASQREEARRAGLFAVHETGPAYLPPGCVTPFTLRVYVA